ncbi:hypothetical protein GGR58DRAFT_380269 [Xylaria digitata]|nr:hypothetical protein GGR58DRAFT_380269 [Xylaria digitata]
MLFIFMFLIVGVLGLDISAAGTINLGVEIGTSTGLGSLNSQPDHWLPTSSTTTISLTPSSATSEAGGAGSHASRPVLISTELSTQTITKTISRITLVTATAQLCTPLSGTAPPLTSSPGTNWLGTAPTHSTRNGTVSFRSFKMGTPPIPSPTVSTRSGRGSTVSFKTGTPPIPSLTISTGAGKNALVQQVWSSFAVMVVALGLLCL